MSADASMGLGRGATAERRSWQSLGIATESRIACAAMMKEAPVPRESSVASRACHQNIRGPGERAGRLARHLLQKHRSTRVSAKTVVKSKVKSQKFRSRCRIVTCIKNTDGWFVAGEDFQCFNIEHT